MTNLSQNSMDELIQAVTGLSDEVTRNADNLENYKKEQALAAERAARRVTTTRRLIYAMAVIAAVVVALGANGFYYQNCRDHRTAAFLAAERVKVCGQIRGEAKIVPQGEARLQRIAKVCGGTAPATPPKVDPVAGVYLFEDRSLTYLETIENTGSTC